MATAIAEYLQASASKARPMFVQAAGKIGMGGIENRNATVKLCVADFHQLF
jgi:hypothetical protein